MVYAALRYLAAGAGLSAFTLWRERTLRIRREDWPLFFGICTLSALANQVSFFYGIRLATASTVSLCFGAMPAFVGLWGLAMGLKRPSRRHWLATVVSFGGVALVAAGGEADLSGSLGGLLLAVGAVASQSLYTVALSRLGERYSPYRISAVSSLGIAAGLVAIGGSAAVGTDWHAIGGLAWGAVGYTTIAGFIVANVLWISGLRLRGANRAALYGNLQVFGGAASGVLMLGEALAALQVVGGAVIALGIALAAGRVRLPRASSVP